MSKNIKLILDGAHGQNNLYTIEDNKFKIHSETIKIINELYTNSEPVLIFGEAISEQYEINYFSRKYIIIGEDIDNDIFLYKMIDGFCILSLPGILETKEVIKQRITNKFLLKKDILKENKIFQEYNKFLDDFDLSNSNILQNMNNNIDKLIEILNLFDKSDKMILGMLNGIIHFLTQIKIMASSATDINPLIEQLYNIRLYLRDYNILKYINTNFNVYNNIIIIIGANHKDGIKTYLNTIFNIQLNDENIKLIGKEEKKSSDILSGGNKLKKYKFTFDLLKIFNRIKN